MYENNRRIKDNTIMGAILIAIVLIASLVYWIFTGVWPL